MQTNELIEQLITQQKSCFLATLDLDGHPCASYTPYAFDLSINEIYIFLSKLSAHCNNLLANPNASILIAEDEAQTQQIYARRRLQYSVNAQHINDDNSKQKILLALKNRHGEIIDLLSSLPDFHTFILQSKEGRYIEGFGKAFSNKNGSLSNGFDAIT